MAVASACLVVSTGLEFGAIASCLKVQCMETIASLHSRMLIGLTRLSSDPSALRLVSIPNTHRIGSNDFARLLSQPESATFSSENMEMKQNALIITLQSLDGPAVSTAVLEIEPSCLGDRVATIATYFNSHGERDTFSRALWNLIRLLTSQDTSRKNSLHELIQDFTDDIQNSLECHAVQDSVTTPSMKSPPPS